LLNKNKIYAKNTSEELYYLKFDRAAFTNALFKEMKSNLYKKIVMLRDAEFF